MTAVADTTADEKRPERRFRDYSHGHVDRSCRLRAQWKVVHLSCFQSSEGVNILAQEGRQAEQPVVVTRGEQIKLIAEQFVRSIGAEPRYSAEEIKRKPEAARSRRSSA